jgi:2-polyprenyl-6-methoxyphenol hydroxylase-like FAD-dependent oxidoreductase
MEKDLKTACCVAGGGPAGIMLGFLLARLGVDVIVLEKYPDFFRDFRGDTIHPSTLEILHELGLLEKFLKIPHDEVRELKMAFGKEHFTIADFTHLPVAYPAIAFMPQWDFLNFMSQEALKYPSFRLMMHTKVVDLIEEDGKVVGAVAEGPEGIVKIHAKLVVGADGRHSTVREKANLPLVNIGAPNDVLWFKLSRHPDDPDYPPLNVARGVIFVMINRGSYWQCGYVIAKGTLEQIKQRGLDAFGHDISHIVDFLKDRVHELKSWDEIKLLDIRVNRLTTWYKPGVLCIGDAAHAMSAIGGVGVNLAVQDAVATAYVLTDALLSSQNVSLDELAAVQKRREFPTKLIQGIQVFVQNQLVKPALQADKEMRPPLILKLLKKWPYLQRFPARIMGMGWRLEPIKKR